MKYRMKSILTALVWCAASYAAHAQVGVVAHRGFWDIEGSAQNSITALQQAANHGFYGSEFDVSITKDGVLVVNHDDNINDIVIETANYADIKACKLKNGETLPTLEQYLLEGKKHPEMKLIFEIKPHKEVVNENRAVDASVQLVKQMGLEKQVEYISFSMHICERLIKLSPQSKVAYLKSDLSPKEVKARKLTGIDYHFKAFELHPEWLDEAVAEKMEVNVWTVDDLAMLKKLAGDKRYNLITTNKPLELKQMLQ